MTESDGTGAENIYAKSIFMLCRRPKKKKEKSKQKQTNAAEVAAFDDDKPYEH